MYYLSTFTPYVKSSLASQKWATGILPDLKHVNSPFYAVYILDRPQRQIAVIVLPNLAKRRATKSWITAAYEL